MMILIACLFVVGYWVCLLVFVLGLLYSGSCVVEVHFYFARGIDIYTPSICAVGRGVFIGTFHNILLVAVVPLAGPAGF